MHDDLTKIGHRLNYIEFSLNCALAKLDKLLAISGLIQQQGEEIMSLEDDLKAGLAKVDVATTEVGAKMAELLALLRAGTLSPQATTEVLGHLDALAASLHGIASDPVNPVPPPTPPVTAALAFKAKAKP